MTERLENNPNFIVTKTILNQTGEFTTKDILESVKNQLLECFKRSVDILLQFIKDKLAVLCEIRLVSDTGFSYYVND